MLEDFFIEFERPGWLLLTLLILPTYLIARGSIGGLSPLKTHATFALRAMVILLLAMALAKPSWQQRGEGLSVVVVVDQSRSIPRPYLDQINRYFADATSIDRDSEDRLGVITFAEDAVITLLPSTQAQYEISSDIGPRTGTNIAEAIRRALAILPDDTASRIVLVSDGNETKDTVRSATDVARALDIPIDVLPIEYVYENEVIFDRLVAPARAREGQVTNLKLIVRSQSETTGTLRLMQNNVPVDLDPDSPDDAIHVVLDPGLNTLSVPIHFDQHGRQKFEASFEPDDPDADAIVDNNQQVAVTFVSGEGAVLVIDGSLTDSTALIDALRESDLQVDKRTPEAIDSLDMLASYDAVVLVNQPRSSFDVEQQDRWLHAYVHDLGGGLVMVGGPDSFGAGGWINTQVEKALPVKLDPPQTMQRTRGALGLIMHSCEIPQANYWGETTAIAAINALSSQDYLGIIDYNYSVGGAAWEYDKTIKGPNLAGDKTAAINAAKSMPVGDMPDFESSMRMMLNGLAPLNAKKHVIIISDGDPSRPTRPTLQGYIDNQITIDTVLYAGHGGPTTMRDIANKTGGTFYAPKSPRDIPSIFIEAARIVARSLIVEQEPPFQFDKINQVSEPTRGYVSVPPTSGYVLTAPKEGLAEIAFTSDTHGDPLYAHWNYGLGKSIAFTPDLTGKWGAAWVAWDGFRGFWDQSIRWVMRPASPSNMIVNTRREGDTAIVEVEAIDASSSFLNNLSIGPLVINPAGEPVPLSMQQIGPGRYRGEFQTPEEGAYLVNLDFREGEERLGNLQASVNVPFAREFRDLRSNRGRMESIASATDGRVLAGDPAQAALFDRTGLEVPRSKLSIWDLLAILAATLFVIDVAARRLSINWMDVRKSIDRAFGRRGDQSQDTVAAWKKARSQVAHRRSDDRDAKRELADRDIKFEADEASSATAIDVGGEYDDAPRTPTEQAPKRRDERDKPEEPDEGDFTSRLLAAKRRARQQQRREDDASGGATDA